MKDNSKNTKEKQYKITVRATEKERASIQEKATQDNSSVSAFLIKTALASESSCKQAAFHQAQRLVQIQRMIDKIEDQAVQSELRKECENVWHCFASLTKAESTETATH